MPVAFLLNLSRSDSHGTFTTKLGRDYYLESFSTYSILYLVSCCGHPRFLSLVEAHSTKYVTHYKIWDTYNQTLTLTLSEMKRTLVGPSYVFCNHASLYTLNPPIKYSYVSGYCNVNLNSAFWKVRDNNGLYSREFFPQIMVKNEGTWTIHLVWQLCWVSPQRHFEKGSQNKL